MTACISPHALHFAICTFIVNILRNGIFINLLSSADIEGEDRCRGNEKTYEINLLLKITRRFRNSSLEREAERQRERKKSELELQLEWKSNFLA